MCAVVVVILKSCYTDFYNLLLEGPRTYYFVGNLEVLNFDSHFPNGHHLGKRKIEPKIDGLCVLGNLDV